MLRALCFGQSLACLGDRPARAGYVSTGAEIIVFRHTVGTKVDLVHLAMDHRQVTMANIAATPNPACRGFGLPREHS
jgi:hypothetical protein